MVVCSLCLLFMLSRCHYHPDDLLSSLLQGVQKKFPMFEMPKNGTRIKSIGWFLKSSCHRGLRKLGNLFLWHPVLPSPAAGAVSSVKRPTSVIELLFCKLILIVKSVLCQDSHRLLPLFHVHKILFYQFIAMPLSPVFAVHFIFYLPRISNKSSDIVAPKQVSGCSKLSRDFDLSICNSPWQRPRWVLGPMHWIRFHLSGLGCNQEGVQSYEPQPVIFSDNSHNNDAVMPV